MTDLERDARREMRDRAIRELREWARSRDYIDIADPDDWERVLLGIPLEPSEP